MSNADSIIHVLRRYREKRGYSQKEISDLTGISYRTVQRIESGVSDMKLSQYRRYLVALDLSDMDVSIALLAHDYVTERDIAALSRRLPYKMRVYLFMFIKGLVEEFGHASKK